MNDDVLSPALDRMTTALLPPVPAEELIAQRRSQLRRRRRVTTGLAAASVLAVAATGGVVAASIGGNAGPAPDGVPVASQSPSSTTTEVDDAGPGCRPDGSATTVEDLQSYVDDLISKNPRLALDIEERTVRAYLLLGTETDAVIEFEARRVGDDVEVVSATRCAP